MREAPKLDLDAHRDVGDLIGATLVVFGRHAGLLLSVTLVVVVPVTILVTGVWAGGFADGGRAVPATAPVVTGAVLSFVMPVLVTALHVVVVRELGAGRVPTVGEALRAAAPSAPRAIMAVVVYTLLGIAGTIALIVPGIWAFVAGYFAAQAAVMERRGPFDAFRRSSELVDGRWWRTAGTLLLGSLLLMVVSYPAGRAIDAIDSGAIYITLYTLLRMLTLSLTALFGTLLYFSLRARKEHPFGTAPVGRYLPPLPPTSAAQSPGDP